MRRTSNNRTFLVSWKIKYKIAPLSFQSKPVTSFHKLHLCLISTLSHYSYRNRQIQHLLTLTDSFAWEELPTRDPETGDITNAGYIPIIQSHTKNIVSFAFVFHVIQCTVRIVMSHEIIFPIWFPVDASRSPIYEIINFIQVMFILLR